MANTAHDIYDRIFKRTLTLSNQAVIRFINGIFQTSYREDSTITYHWTEFEKDSLQKTLADAILTVNNTDYFHVEAQMDKDKDIVLRLMDYGLSQTLRTFHELPENPKEYTGWEMTFPRQRVIYLDKKPNLPEYYPVIIHFQGEADYIHKIPVLPFQDKGPNEIQEQNLIILLPFKLLSLRKDFEKERSKENVERLIKLYQDDIIGVIKHAYELGQLTGRDRDTLELMTNTLLRHLYDKYEEIKEELMKMMYDQSLGLDIDKVYDEIDEMKDALTEKEAIIAEKNSELAEMHSALAEKDEEIRLLKEKLNSGNRL